MVFKDSISFQYSPDLILLDLMLPSVDGLIYVSDLEEMKEHQIFHLMITALGGLKDKVTA